MGRRVRADNPAYLTTAGWQALQDHGIRTIVALRTRGIPDDEPDPAAVPITVQIERVEVEDASDSTFVERCVENRWWETPLHFGEMLEQWPTRCASAVRAVATAPPGGVVISCGRGCDRTGLLTFLLLALVEVGPSVIAADWSRSIDRLVPRHPEQRAQVATLLANANTTVDETVTGILERFDVASCLMAAGLSADQLASARRRLLR